MSFSTKKNEMRFKIISKKYNGLVLVFDDGSKTLEEQYNSEGNRIDKIISMNL